MPRWSFVFVVASALITTACVERRAVGPELSDSRTVPLGGAESASVQVELGAGELKLEGGSPQLLDARFRYVGNAAKPEVRYDLTGSRGYLVLRQPPLQGIGFHDRDFWDLRLNGRVPLDIYVNVGAGQGTFKLGNTAVRRLDIQVGAGELDLDLNGKWEQDLSARITGGVGQATVRLPRDAGVRVRAVAVWAVSTWKDFAGTRTTL
jgi:hypothetical protein